MKRKQIVIGLSFGLFLASMHLAVTAVSRLVPAGPALPPLAHTNFCASYPNDCKPDGKNNTAKADGTKAITLTPERRAELVRVNEQVNTSIVPQRQPENPVHEKWEITPPAGDCNDYVVTKRHALMQKGWPANALLMTEVERHSGEHHLVLIARTSEDDFVLDNLTRKLLSVAEASAEYKWVRMESPDNPKYWERVKLPG
jgi:predicted transglutaminase-like cysteine proteinase